MNPKNLSECCGKCFATRIEYNFLSSVFYEVFNCLNPLCSCHAPPQETGGWGVLDKILDEECTEKVREEVRAVLREKIAEARKEERFNTIRELDHRYGKQCEKAVEESRAQALKEIEEDYINHLLEVSCKRHHLINWLELLKKAEVKDMQRWT